jgi:hypothetical protein
MRKQIAKGLTMLMGITAIAMITAVVSANGQTGSARARIPFEFVVGDKTLPAGSYSVSSINMYGDVLKIAGRNTQASALRLSMAASGTAKRAQLVFHRYGQRYFLAEVWSGSDRGRILTASREELGIQKELSRIASNKSANRNFETVEIAMTLQ